METLQKFGVVSLNYKINNPILNPSILNNDELKYVIDNILGFYQLSSLSFNNIDSGWHIGYPSHDDIEPYVNYTDGLQLLIATHSTKFYYKPFTHTSRYWPRNVNDFSCIELNKGDILLFDSKLWKKYHSPDNIIANFCTIDIPPKFSFDFTPDDSFHYKNSNRGYNMLILN